MEEIKCDSWEDFESKLKNLYELRSGLKTGSSSHVSGWLFRGQANHEWKLTTTLERFRSHTISLLEYYRIISRSKNEIETFIGTSWEIPSYLEYEKWLDEVRPPRLFDLPAYNYMAYLRHHGFPSPLLDWTLSPYIAAFFAFNKASDEWEYVSIYSFLEYAGKSKLSTPSESNIFTPGPYVKTDKRHFLQQSGYTFCAKLKNNQIYHYAKHDEVVARGDENQDLMKKYIIPSKEKIKVLKQLEKYNINPFSLFNSEESLMDTIATREFFLK